MASVSSEVLDCFSLAVERLPLTPRLASLVFSVFCHLDSDSNTVSKARVLSTGWSSFSAGGGKQEYYLPCLYNRTFYCASDFHDQFYTQTRETLRLEKSYVEGESEHQTLNTPTGESAERANTKHTYSAAMSVMFAHLTDLQMSSVS